VKAHSASIMLTGVVSSLSPFGCSLSSYRYHHVIAP
jgi:hypothetical protein